MKAMSRELYPLGEGAVKYQALSFNISSESQTFYHWPKCGNVCAHGSISERLPGQEESIGGLYITKHQHGMRSRA